MKRSHDVGHFNQVMDIWFSTFPVLIFMLFKHKLNCFFSHICINHFLTFYMKSLNSSRPANLARSLCGIYIAPDSIYAFLYKKIHRRTFYEFFMGISKNLPSFRCAVDLVGRRHFKIAGILTYVKIFCAR